ncbi:CHRD domain-containing protein [Dictyobacter arantiisoli]|uniref:CHRD domain-containing protein n=1 Tax=Dictyobacter arantiisoli TaxID=2014874 RepID=A0A5A5TER4_9CHLR|nr:CHRD domain-containing protein [Dictyobacter arantiisoli]GCF09636.1 hypothetical protein KDI_32000 [Dictyobacter arantiisoli]
MLLLTMLWLVPATVSAQKSATTTATAKLLHSPLGKAQLVYDQSNQTLTVTIRQVGLTPNSTHPAHIHATGTCQNPVDTIKYPLNNVVANSTGMGTSITTIANVKTGIPATGWFINVHNGPNLVPAAQYAPISCGMISNASGATAVTTVLGPTTSPNESAMGTGSLSLTNGTLTVTLKISGLAPNSMHAAHIHAGNCLNTGKVLYDLSPLQADSNGSVTKTMTFSNVPAIPSTGWDINVHYTNNIATQTGYNPILCGNIVPA